jgi:isocitrate dehydrogenase
MLNKIPICVARGDGIGPEVVKSTLAILEALKCPLDYTYVDMGKDVYLRGLSAGMTPDAKAAVEDIGVLLKGPMETPKGAGVKSINVTARKLWSVYANKRVFKSIPGVDTVFSKAGVPVNIVMVRENIEDTYGGVEHSLTDDVTLCRRFITRSGSEKVHEYAFQMAKVQGRKAVTCGHKANIMKMTDGMFLETFYKVAKKYPEIKANDMIVDDLAMKLVSRPDRFDTIVLPNLQGDILSDLCAGLVGGLGFAPSANIGDHVSVFEAVHGTAPDIAGKDLANPTALIMSCSMMLRHLGFRGMSKAVDAALLAAVKSGARTADFGNVANPPLSTTKFTEAILAQLPKDVDSGIVPSAWKDKKKDGAPKITTNIMLSAPSRPIVLNGFDFFVESTAGPNALAASIAAVLPSNMKLTMISNRGTQVWPTGSIFTDCVDQYRVRIDITLAGTNTERFNAMTDLSKLLNEKVCRVCSTESLLEIDGKKSYTLAQGQ